MDPDYQLLKDIRWIITRIDGKIASLSPDWKVFGKTASQVCNWKADSIDEISCRKVGTEELFRISSEITWDDLFLIGTGFQKKVWKYLFSLTHGTGGAYRLYSYSEFAEICGNISAVRAVAHAVGLNPVPVIIPCHLIIPKETADRISAIEKEAEESLFGKDSLCLNGSFDFGEFSCPGGKELKRQLILRQFSGQ